MDNYVKSTCAVCKRVFYAKWVGYWCIFCWYKVLLDDERFTQNKAIHMIKTWGFKLTEEDEKLLIAEVL